MFIHRISHFLLPTFALIYDADGQMSTTSAKPGSAISPSPLTTTFVPSSTPPPTSSESQTPDPWKCATSNITQFFDVQKPTGSLLDALDSFVRTLIAPCISSATGLDILSCTVTDPKQYCGFATVAEPAIQTSYSAYGSSVASWYSAKSTDIDNVKRNCPVAWEDFGVADEAWLNYTIAHATCYNEAHPQGNASATSSLSLSKKN